MYIIDSVSVFRLLCWAKKPIW